MKKTLLDSSFLFSVINHQDAHHTACVQIVLDTSWEKHILPTVIPETCYLLNKRLGHPVMRAFVDNLQDPRWRIEQMTAQDFARTSQILNQYADARLDLVDATIVAVAERMGIDTILTLDRRDFGMIRPKHTPYFTLLP